MLPQWFKPKCFVFKANRLSEIFQNQTNNRILSEFRDLKDPQTCFLFNKSFFFLHCHQLQEKTAMTHSKAAICVPLFLDYNTCTGETGLVPAMFPYQSVMFVMLSVCQPQFLIKSVFVDQYSFGKSSTDRNSPDGCSISCHQLFLHFIPFFKVFCSHIKTHVLCTYLEI